MKFFTISNNSVVGVLSKIYNLKVSVTNSKINKIVFCTLTLAFLSVHSFIYAQKLHIGGGSGNHSLVASTDGNLYAWGSNSAGQIGNLTTGGLVQKPVNISAGVTIISVATGANHTLALDSEGKVYAWGNGLLGQLGRQDVTSSNKPVLIDMPQNVKFKAIAAGGNHSLALDTDGNVYAWGHGYSGQLGQGYENDNTPITKDLYSPHLVTMPDGRKAKAIAAGHEHSLALSSDGKVLFAWGSEANGRLGNNSNTGIESSPVQVVFTNSTSNLEIKSITAGAYHSLALAIDGTVWSWGHGGYGQLGNGLSSSKTAIITDLTEIKSVAAGVYFSLVLTNSGVVKAFGYGHDGQLGDGVFYNISPNHGKWSPVTVDFRTTPNAPVIKEISAGVLHALAIDSDGGVWAWGKGSSGQLGQGDFDTKSYAYPVMVKSTTGSGTLNLGPSCTVLENPLAITSPVTEANPTGEPITTVAMNTTVPSIYQIDNPQSGVTYTWSVSYNLDGSENYILLPTVGTQISVIWPENEARVYKVNVTPSIPGCTSTNMDEIYVAVYDPSAGFVTGGGWITSPEGAYKPLEADGTYRTDYISPAGKANFGFVSKYKKGSNVVEGKTEFHFNDGNLRFRSSSHTAETLVISGCKATYSGEGSIEGSLFVYKFKVSAVDGQLNGGGNIDKFRIKIIEKSTGKLVYDNLMGKDDNYDLNADYAKVYTELGGGAVTIHQVKTTTTTSSSSLVAIEPEKLIKPLFVIYPNSFSERTTIAFSLNNEENFSLDLYDMKGALVKRVGVGKAEAGNIYTYEVDGRNMSEGIYLARLISQTKVQSLKLILKR